MQEKCCEKCLNITQSLRQDKQICDDSSCPCHKVQEKSVVERFKLGMAEILGNPNKGKFAMNDMVELFNDLQKETDDKWKKTIEEMWEKAIEITKIIDREERRQALDQATNIIKGLVK